MNATGTLPAPRVSVVIAARNAAATLGETLQSLAAQTMTDFEVLLVDDGSTDDTRQRAEAWAAQDERMRVLAQPNGGVSAARNRGIEAARGEYLLFLDADDLLRPRCLQKLIRRARHRGTDAAYCGYVYLLPDGRTGRLFYDAEIERDPFGTFATRSATCIHSVLVRADRVRQVGGFDEGLATCEDWDLWQRIARQGAVFAGMREALAVYRSRAGSLSFRRIDMLRDAATVFARGHAPDPRVAAPLPALRDGLPPADVRRWQAMFALWCLAADAARGLDSVASVEPSLPFPDLADDIEPVTAHLVDGLLAGSLVDKERLLETWQVAAPILERIYLAAGRGSSDERLPGRIRLAVESEILRICPLRRLTVLTACAGLPITPFIAPPSELSLPVQVRALRVNLQLARQRVLSVLLPVPGYPPGPAIVAAIAGRPAQELRWLSLPWPLRPPAALAWDTFGLARCAAELLLFRTPPSETLRALPLRSVTRRILAACVPIPAPTEPAPTVVAAAQTGSAESRSAIWEEVFAAPDPWKADSEYERAKRERALELLGDWRPARALELGCAEGHFTACLAPRVGELVAVDISGRALARAAERCRSQGNVSFQQLDFFGRPVPAGFDLIVCSEVLYYLRDRRQLRQTLERIAAALNPGGRLLTAHAFVLADDESASGFDWDAPFGMRSILETLDRLPGMLAERSVETEAYAIALYRKQNGAAAVHAPVRQRLDLDAWPVTASRRMFVRGGAVSRCRLLRERRAARVPILMYHRIAREPPTELARYCVTPEQFTRQMDWLRAQGFCPVSVDDVARSIRAMHPLAGRPVAITFDDGYRDFAEEAWPILEQRDLFATVFIPTGAVGDVAHWDAEQGEPAALLGWEELRRLAAAGVHFGSHLVTHRRATSLSDDELRAEALESRKQLEERLGQPVTAVATPYGDGDGRVTAILAACGYRAGVSTLADCAALDASPLAMPRLEIEGSDDLETFVRKLGSAQA